MTRIVYLDGAQLNPGDLDWKSLSELGEVTIYDQSEVNEVVERCADAEIIITNKVPIDDDLMLALTNLKMIIVSATGYNIIDIEAARDAGVLVCNAPDYSSESVAQHVFALILGIYNRVETYAHQVRNNVWTEKNDWSYTLEPIENLHTKTLGIIGFGQIGQKVCEIAQAFGMNVISYHKHPQRDARPNVTFVDLTTLFSTADIITLHVPLNSNTHHIINKEALELMRKDAILFNTGRGPLIDEDALAEALVNGQIRGAGLDVMINEPPRANHPLYACNNCFITPHIAWAGIDARKKLLGIIVENIKAYLSGNPIHVVNR